MPVTLINVNGLSLPIRIQGTLHWKTKVCVVPFHTQLSCNTDPMVRNWQHCSKSTKKASIMHKCIYANI